jgi:hypothetical protein
VYQKRGIRADFIIDDDSDEDNDFWQSDKVRLGLNLAYLPEEMITQINFSDAPVQKEMSKQSSRLANHPISRHASK